MLPFLIVLSAIAVAFLTVVLIRLSKNDSFDRWMNQREVNRRLQEQARRDNRRDPVYRRGGRDDSNR